MPFAAGRFNKVLTWLCVFVMACLVWLPSLRGLSALEADQVFHGFWLSVACRASQVSLGSLDGSSAAQPGGLFALSLFADAQQTLSCHAASWLRLDPAAVYLVGALLILSLLTDATARQAGFSHRARLVLVFAMATAPCSFSRLGHLDQTVLIAVVPTLMACWQLRREMAQALERCRAPQVLLCGALAGAMTFPAQEYYVVFSLLIVITLALFTGLELAARSPSQRPLWRAAWAAGLFIGGFVLVLAVAFLPKLLAAASPGPPGLWMTPRQPTEQMLYGLMPMTWFVPPPLLEPVRGALQDAGFAVQLESYFWSAGSLLIPLALVAAVWRLLRPARGGAHLRLDQRRRFFALLLLIVMVLALLVMTMGGLGTLFATFVSPVLRSLNRFTVFVYGASVVYLVAEFDGWLQTRESTP